MFFCVFVLFFFKWKSCLNYHNLSSFFGLQRNHFEWENLRELVQRGAEETEEGGRVLRAHRPGP